MLAALVALPVEARPEENLARMILEANAAADAGAALVVFPEASLTGLVNTNDPRHDHPLGVAIPGGATDALGEVARRRGLHLAVGLIEREADRLYDAAVLLGPAGDILLHYRRVHPGWHGRNADPAIYCEGDRIARVETELGAFAFLVCGDLFDDAVVERVRRLRVDWVLVPMWRCFTGSVGGAERWEREEAGTYAARVALVGTPVLLVNAFAAPDLLGGAFGGAWAYDRDGCVRSELPAGRAGMLLADLSTLVKPR